MVPFSQSRPGPAYGALSGSLKHGSYRGDNDDVRKLAFAVLALGLVLAGCSSSPPSAQARALAETCNVFKSHYSTKQIDMVATLGQKSGDALLDRDAARLQMDMRKQNDVSSLLDIVKITERCNQLGALPRSDVHT
jgi:hypothetical protein